MSQRGRIWGYACLCGLLLGTSAALQGEGKAPAKPLAKMAQAKVAAKNKPASPPVKKTVAAKTAKPVAAKPAAPKAAAAKPAPAKTKAAAKPVSKPTAKPVAAKLPVKPPAKTAQKPVAKPATKPAAPAAAKPAPKPVVVKPALAPKALPPPPPVKVAVPFAASPVFSPPLPLPPLPIFWQPPPMQSPNFRAPIMQTDQIEALKLYLGLSPLAKPAKPKLDITFSHSLAVEVLPNPIDLLVLGETEEEHLARRNSPPPTAAPQAAPEAAASQDDFITPPRRIGQTPRTPHQSMLAELAEKNRPASDAPQKGPTLAMIDKAPGLPPTAALSDTAPLSFSPPVFLPDGRRVLNLREVLRSVMTDNKELMEKRAKLDELTANELGLASRFSPHFNMVAKWDRDKNGFLSQNFPPLELSTLTNSGVSFGSSPGLGGGGGLDLGGLDLGSLDLDGLDASSLAGIDLSSFDTSSLDLSSIDLNSLSTSGVDLNSLDLEGLDLSTVDLNSLNLNDLAASNPDLLSQVLGGAGGGGARGVNIQEDTRLSVQFARRVYEFGRENVQDVQQREKRRQAYVDYEKKLRELLAEARKKFFTALLKEKQITVREQLLTEFQKKHERLKTRFEQAQDILKIDVLTSELDVLNERLVINGLDKEKLSSAIALAKLMGRKYDAKELFTGELDRFPFTEDDVVRVAHHNSYASHLMREQINEQQQILKDMVWTWRPSMALRGGIEYRHASLGVGLNQSGGTFGVDVGAEGYMNLPDLNMDAFDGDKQKYAVNIGLNWPFYSGKDRAAVMNRERAVLAQLKAKLKIQQELEEQQARTAFQTLREARERERLQAERVNISRRRLQITQVLRDSGKVSEVSLETFRDRFFSDQDSLFREQNNVIEVQETLRELMGVFE